MSTVVPSVPKKVGRNYSQPQLWLRFMKLDHIWNSLSPQKKPLLATCIIISFYFTLKKVTTSVALCKIKRCFQAGKRFHNYNFLRYGDRDWFSYLPWMVLCINLVIDPRRVPAARPTLLQWTSGTQQMITDLGCYYSQQSDNDRV